MKPAEFRAVFLSGDVVYVRAYVDQDKEVTAAWAGTPFPVGSPRGEKLLKEWHTEWWPRTRHYALCHASTDEVVGGVIVGIRHLVAEFIVTVAPWRDDADELRAEAIKLIVPWLSDEWSMVSVQAHMAADEPACIAATEELGMSHQVTLREALIRPAGDRTDHLIYQKLSAMEAVVDA